MSDHMTGNGTKGQVSAALNCIDLSNPDIHQSVALIRQACLDCGIFYVINHGISEELMDDVFAQSKKFSELPLNDKMKLCWNEKRRGYQPHDKNGHGGTYHIGVEVPEDDPEAEKPFYGPNIWPSAALLPGWKETMQRYHQEALDVGRAIVRIIALALDINIDFFDQPELLGNAISSFYIIHYEAQTIDPLKEKPTLPAHTDYSLITLLATDDVFGLQICKNKYDEPKLWEDVAPLKRAFIVTVGDILERLSNGVFGSTLHRVVICQERYSTAVFVCPSHDGILDCLPTCKSEENPPKYPPIKCEEFVSSCLQQVYGGRIENKAEA